MSLAVEFPRERDTTPVQNIRKADATRKNKKNEAKEQALRKRRVKARRGNKQDPWVGSRKGMTKKRNNRKNNRRAKIEGAALPMAAVSDTVDRAAPAASVSDPGSDAAPTTPLTKGNSAAFLRQHTPPVDISDYPKVLDDLAAGSPPAPLDLAADRMDVEPPVLETVREGAEAGDFSVDYIAKPQTPNVGRSHTNVNQKKKLRRPKRGKKAGHRKYSAKETSALSHTANKKEWKQRRRNARRMKTELHYDGLGITGSIHGSEVASSQPAPGRRNKGKWVKKATSPEKGDCVRAEEPAAEAPGEAVPGRVEPKAAPVENKNAFDVLSRNKRKGNRNRYYRRNPRWRRNRKKFNKNKKTDNKKADQPAETAAPKPAQAAQAPAEAPQSAPAAKPVEATKPKAAPAHQRRGPNRRRKFYWKKKGKPGQKQGEGGKQPAKAATASEDLGALLKVVQSAPRIDITHLVPVPTKKPKRRQNKPKGRKGGRRRKPKITNMGPVDL